ncbi:hypothetical protein GcM3_205026 [Golovinomyces cichoracearum]|uniref:Uncharacterized protein n=1 Tax=Golovinomyces cichoracearum TaxID=62708 RepID=A0A420HC05_9PEZI|nr:hypothetical protein GcM3_205026 [Golovinomyces cichoracearum]
MDALRIAENLLSRGIDPELGGSRPQEWEESLGEKLTKLHKKSTINRDKLQTYPGEKAWGGDFAKLERS